MSDIDNPPVNYVTVDINWSRGKLTPTVAVSNKYSVKRRNLEQSVNMASRGACSAIFMLHLSLMHRSRMFYKLQLIFGFIPFKGESNLSMITAGNFVNSSIPYNQMC